MRDIAVYGIGNALIDILLELDESDFTSLGLEKATMRLVEIDEQNELLQKFFNHKPVLASGGSVANSIIALSQLGACGAYACCIGDDEHGTFYRSEFQDLGIQLSGPSHLNKPTGTSAVLVTPDAERTMRTCLAASTDLSPDCVSEEMIKNSEWVFIEGYLFSNPGSALEAVMHTVELCEKHQTKIAVTFSEGWVVENFGDSLRPVVEKASLVFANEDEAKTFTGAASVAEAVDSLSTQLPMVAVTAGADGAYFCKEGKVSHAKSFPCEPVDLTGAGDMFAGAMLYGISNDLDPEVCLRAACYLSSKVIVQMGARLREDVKEFWEEVAGE